MKYPIVAFRLHTCNFRCNGKTHYDIVVEYGITFQEKDVYDTALSYMRLLSAKRINEYPTEEGIIGAWGIYFEDAV